MRSISIIIPTLNEEREIGALLEHLRSLDREPEIIVADGGSRDRTMERARGLATVIRGPRGRAAQMNAAARVARGDVLWFVHADCRPHPASLAAIDGALGDRRVVGGAFSYVLDAPGSLYRLSEALSNGKNRLFRLFYGDMGIFIRAETFHRLGGYAGIPLMEDADLCRRMKKMGRIVILPETMTTSPRRWKAEGAWRNIFRTWVLQVAWALGVPPSRLARYYPYGLESGSGAQAGMDATAGTRAADGPSDGVDARP